MKKLGIFLLFAILVFAAAALSLRQSVQAVQTIVPAATVTESQILKGISKIKSGSVNAVILGESIAACQGASDPATTGWYADLNKDLFENYSHKIVWDNKSSAGKLIDYSLERAKEIKSNTDAVFIFTGRIDRNFSTPEQFSEKYTQLINGVKSKAPNADIFCIAEPPMIEPDETKFAGIRKTIIDVAAKNGVNLIDVWSAFPQDQAALSILLEDVLHPNDAGNKLMADYIYHQLVTLIDANK